MCQVGILTAPPLSHARLPSLLQTTSRSRVVLSGGDVWVSDLGGKYRVARRI